MTVMRKFAAAAVILLAGPVLALSACSPSTTKDPGGAKAPSVNPVPESGERDVQVEKVLSGDTVVVSPKEDSDQLHGKEFTVRILDVTAPQKDECGFEKSKAFAEEWFKPAKGKAESERTFTLSYPDEDSPVPPINKAGEHRGAMSFNGGNYTQSIREGYTVPNDENGHAVSYQGGADDAKTLKRGVYADCPDFGKQ